MALDLPIEVDERLGREEDVARALELIPTVDEGPVVFCTHSEIIAPMLQTLELGGPEQGTDVPCKKGSVWLLDGPGLTPSRASYLEPVRRTKRGGSKLRARRKAARARSVRAAVLDLGSTSFTLLIADVRRDGEIRHVVREKVMLRLARSTAGDALIPDAAFREAVGVARELHAVTNQEKVEHFVAVATAAVRDAGNGRELAAAVSRAIGEPVRVLSGEEEARTTFRAFQRRLDLGSEPVIGIDLGPSSSRAGRGTALSAA